MKLIIVVVGEYSQWFNNEVRARFPEHAVRWMAPIGVGNAIEVLDDPIEDDDVHTSDAMHTWLYQCAINRANKPGTAYCLVPVGWLPEPSAVLQRSCLSDPTSDVPVVFHPATMPLAATKLPLVPIPFVEVTTPSNLIASADLARLRIPCGAKVILIPSVTHVANPHLKSKFCMEERFEQTLRQLRSCRDCYPDAVTILMEVSALSPYYLRQYAGYASWVVTFDGDADAAYFANHWSNKNPTEVYLLLKLLRHVKQFEPSHVAKFGGRYWFARPSDLFRSKTVCKVLWAPYYGQKVVEPVFFSVPAKDFGFFEDALAQMMAIHRQPGFDVERQLWTLFASYLETEVPAVFQIKGYGAHHGAFRYF